MAAVIAPSPNPGWPSGHRDVPDVQNGTNTAAEATGPISTVKIL